ncbi:MAG TPA: HAD-IIB family hydrolase, partial [Stellaceae bacterium]|nr:HAD-IIB family hydrolase [Stellaceae bacterium]
IDPDVARAILAFLDAQAIEAWLFTGTEWLTRDPNGVHVEHETRTVQQAPRIVTNFDAVIDRAGKIVGVSDDFARLEAIEGEARAQFAGRAMAVRSQTYYLDFVAPGVDKGLAVRELSKTIGIPFDQIVTLGDMENDVSMFRQAGFSIAMGNASDAVKAQAQEATLTNDDDGFAAAVEKFILPRAKGS